MLPQLKYLDELTQGALTEMRMLLMELRPEALQDIALDELLRRMVITLKTRKQIPITAAVDPMPELPHEVKVALYRIAQESLNNVAKHSQAKRVSLELSRDNHCITLMICDDGVGFENQKAAGTSYGLKIMRERAEEIGAGLSIESKAGAGTIVRVKWACDPLAPIGRPDELAN